MSTTTTPSRPSAALGAALTFALGLLAAAPAASAAVTYTYAGTVKSGFDQTGVFGLAGQDFAGLGLTFTARFVREDLPGADYLSTPTSTEIRGLFPNSPVRGEVTINGHTVSFDSYLGQQIQMKDPDFLGSGSEYEQFAHNVDRFLNSYDAQTGVTQYINTGLLVGGFGIDQNFLASPDYHTLSNLSSAQGVEFVGQAHVAEYVTGPDGVRQYSRYSIARFTPTSLTVSDSGGPVAGVPEPSAWALMILGFGSTGAMLRARRRGLVPA